MEEGYEGLVDGTLVFWRDLLVRKYPGPTDHVPDAARYARTGICNTIDLGHANLRKDGQ